MRGRIAALALPCLYVFSPLAAGQQINEIRLNEPGADDNEYVELTGPPETPLNGLTLVIIGDSLEGGSGVVEEAVDLTGQAIGASGFFLIAEDADTFGQPADLVVPLNMENGDNVTYLLVEEFKGLIDQDLDADDDGILDEVPWSRVFDCIAMVLPPGEGDQIYCESQVGPDAIFVPAHAFRCVPDGTWLVGAFDPIVGNDTPGSANPDCEKIPMVELIADKSGPTVAVAGGQAIYTLEISNNGIEPALDVVITDTLPAGMTFAGESSPALVSLDDSVAPDIVWSVDQVPAGGSILIELAVDIDAGAIGLLDNILEVTTTSDDDPLDNVDTVTTTVNPEIIAPDLVISELRLDQPGGDNDEYFELLGTPGTSLTGVTYLVIGDGAVEAGSGVVEMALPLSGLALPLDDGRFLAVEDTMTLVPIFTADLVVTGGGIDFENGDNVTHLIVANFVGGPGMDLDTNDDGLLDQAPWSDVIDAVGIIEEGSPPLETEFSYAESLGFDTVGPDGGFVPDDHVYRCQPTETWAIGPFDPAGGEDTPGSVNLQCSIALFVSKSGPTVAVAGATAVYTLTVFNVGREPAANVSIIDTLPPGLTFVGESSPIDVTLVDSVGPTIEWTTPLMLPGVIEIEIAVEYDAALEDEVVNTVTVSTTTPGDDPKDNTAEVSTVVSLPVVPPAGLELYEMRIDQSGPDDDEYFEIRGSANTDLAGLAYLVIGDGAPELGSGVVETAIGLSGLTVGGDGIFFAAEDTITIGNPLDADLLFPKDGLNFENSDNVTHLIVANFTGGPGLDLDTNDDGTLDLTPWTHVLDALGIIEMSPPELTEFAYAASLGFESIGPDGTFAPSHVFRCEPDGTWTLGAFDAFGPDAVDTPGATNASCGGGLPCPADTNGDGSVDVQDLTNVILDWGTDGQGGGNDSDINDDGLVNVQDLTAVILAWGLCP